MYKVEIYSDQSEQNRKKIFLLFSKETMMINFYKLDKLLFVSKTSKLVFLMHEKLILH
jgi:hypothetical protein